MLKFYYGTKLELLADRLLTELDENPPKDLLAPEVFVVQNHGIGQWLSLHMAQNKGIAANLRFEFPSERIWSLIRQLKTDIPKSLPSDRQPMTWTLMELFSDEGFLDDFEQVRDYIFEGKSSERAMRRWKLADKIADVFDQYLIYRPRMILDWEDQKLHSKSVAAEKWQMQLWNKLLGYWEENYDGKYLHRARLQRWLWQAIDDRQLDTENVPDRITVFGVSTASPAFIETMVKLSKLTEVCFYQLSVDPQIKESELYRNPMLQSLGSETTDYIALLSSFVKGDEEVDKNIAYQSVEDANTSKESVLQNVQGDLRQNSISSKQNSNISAADPSIQVHACHSPMREVEVLYDQLLAVLDQNPDMNADDILIMTPDIETYAPMIEAVFATPDEGQPEIPYSIVDRGTGGDDPATASFLKMLELCESRFKVTDVLDLLDVAPIQEAFEFADDELNKLERWIRDNRIRWGIDGSSKKEIGLPGSDHFTWQSGLRRILLGYMMRSEEDKLYQDTFAYDEVETSDDAELAGKLSYFLNQLFKVSRQVATAKPPRQWQQELSKVIDQFLPDNRDYFWEIIKIREAINGIADCASLAGYSRKVPFSIIRRWLREQLQGVPSGGGRIGRGITFSSLKPMRSIPFEVIGMIGMNEGAFPSSKIPIEFDLMHLNPRRGDPKRSEEDRYLFLENLLSARTHFYVSYVGKSNRQDADFPPSVVVRELLDYLEGHYGLDPENIITEHRLQAFSPHYFTKDDYFSYSDSQLKISQQLSGSEPSDFFDGTLPEPDEEWKQLTVNDLISFFQHPAKFILRNRLGIYLWEEEVLTEDREPFSLDKLDKYQVEQELLERFLKEKPLDGFEKVMHSRDLLPEGWSGDQVYQQKSTEVTAFGNEIKQRLDQQQLSDIEVNIEIDGFWITGMLSDIYKEAQITFRFGRARAKDKIDWWIRHLVFQLVKPQEHPGKSLLFAWDSGSFEKYRLSPSEHAGEILAKLLQWYWQGLQKPLQLYCKSSYAFAERVVKDEKDIEEGIERAVKEWETINTPNYSRPGEGDDAYNKLVTEGRHPFEKDSFRELSREFWSPFFDVLSQEDA